MIRSLSVSILSGFALALFVSPLGAQIVLDSGDIPHVVGDTSIYKFSDEQLSIDIGTIGGPQSWTFDTSFSGGVYPVVVVGPGSTPFAGQFPDASMAWKYAEPDSGDFYTFMNLAPGYLTDEGFGFDLPETTVAMVWDIPDTLIVFPAMLGSSWSSHAVGTDTLNPQTWMTFERITHNDVDAFGTMTIPLGTRASLRISTLDTTITTTCYMGVPILVDTTVSMEYIWVTYHLGILASVSEASLFARDSVVGDLQVLVSTTIGVEESPSPYTRPELLRVSPNPFTVRTEIHLSSALEEETSVILYDPTGRRIRTLFEGNARELHLSWDGRDDGGRALPCGIYLCRIRTGMETRIERIVLRR
jgi:hypothetical protein